MYVCVCVSYTWLNNAVSTSHCTVLNGRITMNNELERVCKEAVLSQYLPPETEETMKEPQSR